MKFFEAATIISTLGETEGWLLRACSPPEKGGKSQDKAHVGASRSDSQNFSIIGGGKLVPCLLTSVMGLCCIA